MKQYELLKTAKIASVVLLSAFLFISIGVIIGIEYNNSKNANNSSEIRLEKNPDNLNTNNIIKKDLNQVKYPFVASRNSDIFYDVNCGASNRIKEENRIYFETEDEALKNGYRPSSQCK